MELSNGELDWRFTFTGTDMTMKLQKSCRLYWPNLTDIRTGNQGELQQQTSHFYRKFSLYQSIAQTPVKQSLSKNG
jgi:hypothetical protein